MSVERLTYRLKSGATNLVGILDAENPAKKAVLRQNGWERLSVYEDILFDSDGHERISIDRLRELAEADKDGRLVVLPEDTKKGEERG